MLWGPFSTFCEMGIFGGENWGLVFLDLKSSLLIPQFSNPACYIPLCGRKEPSGQEDHEIRAACWCHHQHGRHCALWSSSSCVYCATEWLGSEHWADRHDQVRYNVAVIASVLGLPQVNTICEEKPRSTQRWNVLLVYKSLPKVWDWVMVHASPVLGDG